MDECRVGGYLDEHYKRIVMRAERKLFPCCKYLPHKILRNEYPACREKVLTLNPQLSWTDFRNLYYGILIEDIKKRHPEKVMEALMCGEDW